MGKYEWLMKAIAKLYSEEQPYDSQGLRIGMGILYTGVLILLLVGAYYQFVLGISWGSKPLSDKGFIIMAVLVILIMLGSGLLMFSSRLLIRIMKEGIYYSYPPLMSKEKFIPKTDILSYELRTYKPIKEYGGWGIKQGKKKNDKAFNVRGNKGMQLYLKGDKKLLLGTARGAAFKRAMERLMEDHYG